MGITMGGTPKPSIQRPVIPTVHLPPTAAQSCRMILGWLEPSAEERADREGNGGSGEARSSSRAASTAVMSGSKTGLSMNCDSDESAVDAARLEASGTVEASNTSPDASWIPTDGSIDAMLPSANVDVGP